jgi:hypothetical protein
VMSLHRSRAPGRTALGSSRATHPRKRVSIELGTRPP